MRALLLSLCLAAPAAAQAPPPASGGTVVINFLGPVTAASAAELARAAQDAAMAGADTVRVNLYSGGGKISAARFAVNALASLPVRIDTVAMSEVASAAVPIFCMGEARAVAPGASLYLHALTRFAERSPKTAAAHAREDEIVQGWYEQSLRECLDQPERIGAIEGWAERDRILDREEAYALGMANRPFAALRKDPLFGRAVTVIGAADALRGTP